MQLGDCLTVVGLAIDIAAVWVLYATTRPRKVEDETITAENERFFSDPRTPARLGPWLFRQKLATHNVWKGRVARNRNLQLLAMFTLSGGFCLQIAGQILARQ